MNGPECPLCGCGRMISLNGKTDGYTDILSTTNEWKYYCPRCDIRFNSNREWLGPHRKGLIGMGDLDFKD